VPASTDPGAAAGGGGVVACGVSGPGGGVGLLTKAGAPLAGGVVEGLPSVRPPSPPHPETRLSMKQVEHNTMFRHEISERDLLRFDIEFFLENECEPDASCAEREVLETHVKAPCRIEEFCRTNFR
jgi:hypothetical protein